MVGTQASVLRVMIRAHGQSWKGVGLQEVAGRVTRQVGVWLF